MALQTYTNINFTDAGGTFTVDVTQVDNVILVPDTLPITMTNNVEINFDGTPNEGDFVTIGWGTGITIGANTFTINGVSMSATQMVVEGSMVFFYSNGNWGDTYMPDLRLSSVLSGSVLVAGTVGINKLESGTPAQIVIVNSGGIPTLTGVTGVVAITDGGVTSIVDGSIVNADINASAAIARTKLANGTANQVVINDGSGVMSSEAQLATVRGGTGADTSGSTGFPTINAGAWTVGAISEIITLDVSFETDEIGDFKIKMPYAGTVTGIYAFVTKAIAATDDATIVPKNNAGTTMGSGTITFTAADPRGTAETSTPSTNNTFIANDVLTFTTAKTTAGGKAVLSISVTRTS